MTLQKFTEKSSLISSIKLGRGSYIAGYESGFCGFGIQRQLSALGIECILLNAADIAKGDKERKQKNDKRDARSISQLLSNKKDVKSLYVPTLLLPSNVS